MVGRSLNNRSATHRRIAGPVAITSEEVHERYMKYLLATSIINLRRLVQRGS
jgi:hypothetical protein